jgi:hypothetical protein
MCCEMVYTVIVTFLCKAVLSAESLVFFLCSNVHIMTLHPPPSVTFICLLWHIQKLVNVVWLGVLGFCWWQHGRVQFTGGSTPF